MDSANKALIMAFGMLIAVIIMTTIVFVFTRIAVLPVQDDNIEKTEQTRLFNQEYEVYDKKIMYGVDVISVLNKAKSNNEKYIQGKFLSGTGYNTDYIINIVVTFKKELEETIEVTYLDSTQNIVEILYANSGPEGIKANSVFKAPDANYQNVIYHSSNYWNSLKLEAQTIGTGIGKNIKEYQLLGGSISKPVNGITNYTNEMIEGTSVLKELLTQSATMSQTVRNMTGEKYGNGKGWNRATWYPAIYDMKTRKFKCVGDNIVYNTNTGRICYMEFEELDV